MTDHSNDPGFTAEREAIRARYTADTMAPTESAEEYARRMDKAANYLRNDCPTCGAPMLGVHYHEADED